MVLQTWRLEVRAYTSLWTMNRKASLLAMNSNAQTRTLSNGGSSCVLNKVDKLRFAISDEFIYNEDDC